MSYPSGPQTVINKVSMATNITSQALIIKLLYAASFSLSWSGSTPIGAVSVQGSNDYAENADGSISNAGTWNTLTLNYNGSAVTSVPVTGNTGVGMIDITATAIYAVRLVYTATSGTGILTAVFNAKG